MALVVDQPERVTQWVSERLTPGAPTPPAYSALGFELDGQLIAGAFFDGMSDTNVFAHLASAAAVMPAPFLAALASFTYGQIGAARATFMVYDTNLPCRQLVTGLGAEPEFVMRGAHSGGDVIGYVLTRDKCNNSRFYRRLIKSGRAIDLNTLPRGAAQ